MFCVGMTPKTVDRLGVQFANDDLGSFTKRGRIIMGELAKG